MNTACWLAGGLSHLAVRDIYRADNISTFDCTDGNHKNELKDSQSFQFNL
ncbi:MAG: hypothetical protein JKY52_20385 [Flavobacteriales bacterium]|nr:hypothetical protein [Flavobacteriales bacterium]